MSNGFDFGKTLRASRILAGKSVEEISDYLTQLGYKANIKTIYSWENNRSQPTPGAFLYMCTFYGITDILGTFGYKRHDAPQLDARERKLLDDYRTLNEEGQEKVLEYTGDLAGMDKYKKSDKLSLDAKEA